MIVFFFGNLNFVYPRVDVFFPFSLIEFSFLYNLNFFFIGDLYTSVTFFFFLLIRRHSISSVVSFLLESSFLETYIFLLLICTDYSLNLWHNCIAQGYSFYASDSLRKFWVLSSLKMDLFTLTGMVV